MLPRLILLVSALLCAADVEASPASDGQLASLFQDHCLKCHDAETRKGKVNLQSLDVPAALMGDADLIRDLIEVLEFQDMPPEDEPPVADRDRKGAIAHLKRLLHRALAAETERPATPIRRMNRFQYHNAVKDLFDLSVEVFSLPERMCREYGNYFQPATGRMPDVVQVGSRPLGKSQLIEKRLAGVAAFPQDLRAEHGFDNRGDHLTLSPLLMESFLRLGKSIVGSRDFNPKTCGIWDSFFAKPPAGTPLEPEVRNRLRDFLTRAFRRPVEDSVLQRYVSHVLGLLDSEAAFPDAMKEAAAAALVSPRFLYLYDAPASGTGNNPAPADLNLASRLSFFLWGSLPDRELLDLAAAGKLHEPDSLEEQVDRLLRDDRLKRFCDSFPTQWLQLERIVTSVPDRDRYPGFYFAKYRTSMDMMLEPLLLFETLLIENRSVIELIDSDFSYRSKRLQAWYGTEVKGKLGGPTRLRFERVPVTDRREGGVITTAAVMTMTSGPQRTHPITRGAWMATAIFNDPPKPPPADVPPLEEAAPDTENLTLRERFALHRKRTDCAACHQQIDPLGFALENYGAAGTWRDTYDNGRDVDPSGLLFRTHEFANIVEFKDAILAEKDRFLRALAEHLLSFALGREVAAADSPAVDRIVEKVAADGYRFHALIHAIVKSEPFLQRAVPANAVAANTP